MLFGVSSIANCCKMEKHFGATYTEREWLHMGTWHISLLNRLASLSDFETGEMDATSTFKDCYKFLLYYNRKQVMDSECVKSQSLEQVEIMNSVEGMDHNGCLCS